MLQTLQTEVTLRHFLSQAGCDFCVPNLSAIFERHCNNQVVLCSNAEYNEEDGTDMG